MSYLQPRGTYERLDHGCKADVLHVGDDEVILIAFWPSDDKKNFRNVHGVAQNTVVVSRKYFQEKYGVAL